MARILAISSQVASGHVGLSAIVPALQMLGHDVIALPTILLSNHPGTQPATGTPMEPSVLEQMLATLNTNGRLDNIDAILTGYLPSAAHVAVAATAIKLCQSKPKPPLVLCDPVIGDDPKGLYIDVNAATAIRTTLLPVADIITPNRFELAWLSGQTVSSSATAITAARSLGRQLVVATSIPADDRALDTIAITASNTHSARVAKRASAPNGTGDLLAALFLSKYLETQSDAAIAVAFAVEMIEKILEKSSNHAELQLIPTQAIWSNRHRPTK